MPRRYCCVFGCHNNDSIVKDWETETCKIHNVINATQQCDCPLPFFLLTFPTKDAKLREEWIRRINWKNWKLSYDSRICSVHIADVDLVKRKTSPQHPYPTIQMGYELSGERARQKRKQPTPRLNWPPFKWKYTRKCLASHCEQDLEGATSVKFTMYK